VASNDINENALHNLTKEGHNISIFGVGTNLVTCQAQPALGCVYKLVELNGTPRMKLSHDIVKVLIPGRKIPYRLFGKNESPLIDLMVGMDEAKPETGKRILCRHPFFEQKRVSVSASRVDELHVLTFDGENGVMIPQPEIANTKKYVLDQISGMRPDLLRNVDSGVYKVSVTKKVFTLLHHMWETESIVLELD